MTLAQLDALATVDARTAGGTEAPKEATMDDLRQLASLAQR